MKFRTYKCTFYVRDVCEREREGEIRKQEKARKKEREGEIRKQERNKREKRERQREKRESEKRK